MMPKSNRFLVFMLFAVILGGCAQKEVSADPQEIRQLVERYVNLIDSGDVSGQMRLWGDDPGLLSVVTGYTQRSRAEIQKLIEMGLPIAAQTDFERGEIHVVPLGADAAFAVLELNTVPKKDTNLPREDGVLTVVFKRTSSGWKLVHEHYGTRPAVDVWKDAREK